MANELIRERKIKRLPNNIEKAIDELCNTPQHRHKAEEEKKIFLLYLNFAVCNIQQIAGVDVTDEKKIADAIEQKGDTVIQKLANFLWLFNVDEPGNDFKDYKAITLKLVTKIFALRNLFAHPQGSDITPLLSDRDFYVVLEGILLSYAQDNALGQGLKTDKLFKLKLMNIHSDTSERDFDANKQYELTRKGIIFLTCMALYKNEAMEFCQMFVDMKLPQRCPADAGEECKNIACCGSSDAKPCNYAKAKALITMFTYFSCRKGRDVLDAADLDFMSFADIMTYLNKVPSAAMDYLPLLDERNMLAEKAAISTESEKNKLYKYSLHRRFKDRFLAFAAAYCEDFSLLPVLHFKRLDISEHIGRKRYAFGSENDNRNRMDRHYVIKNDSIAFEFLPTEHYGDIKISSLRGNISETLFKKLLYAMNCWNPEVVNAKLKEYLTAYHKVLEKMLNTGVDEDFYLEDFEDEFSIITGFSGDELFDNFEDITQHYFPGNLSRFFTASSNEMGQEEMFEWLTYRLKVLKDQSVDFQKRLKKFEEWRSVPAEKRTTPRPPVCGGSELSYPPYTTSFSDGDLIVWVFKALNLHLTPENKFRQLPRGEQHNKGMRDHEYQMLHRAIGKYSLDQKSIAGLLNKLRPELSSAWSDISGKVSKLFSIKSKEMAKNPRMAANGRPLRASKTLHMLATAAAQHCQEYYQQQLTKYNKAGAYGIDNDVLRAECRRFGVKVGMPLDRNSLIKTILGIDENQWKHAYDYSNKRPFVDRKLSNTEHIFTKVPLPNDFAERIVPEKIKTAGSFDFNKAMREMKIDLQLRNYYDISAMVDYLHSGNSSKLNTQRVITRGENTFTEHVDLSRTAVNKALSGIRKCEYQDKLLSIIALKYRERFMAGESMFDKKVNMEDNVSIYDFFEKPVTVAIKKTGGVKVSILPNDLLRPAFALIRTASYLRVITAAIDPVRKEFDYYELQEKLSMIQAEDRRKRLEFLPAIINFERIVQLPKGLIYSKNSDKAVREKENRDIEYPYYRGYYNKLTREEFDIIADARNAVYHNGIGLDIRQAMEILQKHAKSPVKREW